MSSATIILLGALLLLGGCVAFVFWPRGRRCLVITDVSRPFSASVSSPIPPFGSGALFVIVEGQLDGDAILVVTSNHGQDRREFPLHGPLVSFITGGAEDWVDDLQVSITPRLPRPDSFTSRSIVALALLPTTKSVTPASAATSDDTSPQRGSCV